MKNRLIGFDTKLKSTIIIGTKTTCSNYSNVLYNK